MRHVIEDQAGRAQPGVRGARRGDLLPPGVLREHAQPPRDGPVRDRRHPGFPQHPQAVQLADRLDDPRRHQLAEHLIAARGRSKPEHPIGMLQRVQQAAHPRGDDRQRPARRAGSRPRSSSPCPAASFCRAAAFSSSTSASSCAEPRCSISRDPRCEECTICTAVAPDDVFTVRRYGDTRPQYGAASAQFRHSPTTEPAAHRPGTQDQLRIVAEVRTRARSPSGRMCGTRSAAGSRP